MKKTKKNLSNSPQKIALVHDFLREYGGAERVLEALHKMYPEAPVYVAFLDKKALGKHWKKFEDWDIREAWFSKIPLHKKLYSPLRFFAPQAFMDLDLSEYDTVISSSNAFEAKAVKTKPGRHFCYCHTPPRALYGYSTASEWKKNPLIKFFGTIINHYMRVIDFRVAQKVDHFIANSQETASRIKKFYRRNSVVIYPPVEIGISDGTKSDKNMASKMKKVKRNPYPHTPYYFYISRLVLQKHPELAVEACNKLGLSLKVAGSGQMMTKLKEISGGTVEFLGSVSDGELSELYSGAKAVIFPVEDEDFGIVPVEAMIHGVPVIAHKSGGPIETVVDGKTGVFFDELSVDGVIEAIKKFEKLEKAGKFDKNEIKKWAEKFNRKSFEQKIRKTVGK